MHFWVEDKVTVHVHKVTVHVLFTHCSWDPQPLYSEKNNLKMGLTVFIHTFKNYFTTVFSVFNF